MTERTERVEGRKRRSGNAFGLGRVCECMHFKRCSSRSYKPTNTFNLLNNSSRSLGLPQTCAEPSPNPSFAPISDSPGLEPCSRVYKLTKNLLHSPKLLVLARRPTQAFAELSSPPAHSRTAQQANPFDKTTTCTAQPLLHLMRPPSKPAQHHGSAPPKEKGKRRRRTLIVLSAPPVMSLLPV